MEKTSPATTMWYPPGTLSSRRFIDMAQRAFSFLEEKGFLLVQSESRTLRYEDSQVFVAIEWDDRSGELNVYLGLQPKKGAACRGILA